jgi:hypothetical protein
MKIAAVVKLLSAGVLLIVTSGCGTPGAPMPPSLDLPKPVQDLQASRRGDVVTLSWTVPQETTDQTTMRKLGVTRVCRAINQVYMQTCAAVLEVPPPAGAKPDEASGKEAKQLTARDTLPPTAGLHDFAVYAVEVENARARSAGLSNQVPVPLSPISQPEALSEAKVTPDAVLVGGSIKLSPLTPEQERFRLSRHEKGSDQQIAVAEIPRPRSGETGETISVEFRDETFEWEKSYEYSLSVIGSENLPGGKKAEFESDSSPALSITPHDVYPPATPTGVQAVHSGVLEGSGDFIDVTWNANNEKDLAGYNVYRRGEQEFPADAVRINSKLLITPSFRDDTVQKGRRYFYSVSAIDVRNNESEHSTEASEFVPK